MPFEVVVSRIETQATEAIVNPANQQLLPGGGADGAIRAAAGEAYNKLLRTAGPLAIGGVLVTPGFQLPAKWVLHTAAPMYWMPAPLAKKRSLLAQCYRSCFEAAADLRIGSLAFPAIGAGAYGWPIERQSDIAVRAAIASQRRYPVVSDVVFCCFTEEAAILYRRFLAAYLTAPPET